MIDKVQKIRKKVEGLFNHVKDSNFESDSGAFYYLKDLLDFIDSLQKEPVSEELENAAKYYIPDESYHMVIESKEEGSGENVYDYVQMINMFKAAAKWQKANLWKPADGNKLPEIDREVIALLDNGKLVFAHRPPEFWDGKDIVTGKVTRNYPKTYDKGGWNIPDIKWWLDVELPKK